MQQTTTFLNYLNKIQNNLLFIEIMLSTARESGGKFNNWISASWHIFVTHFTTEDGHKFNDILNVDNGFIFIDVSSIPLRAWLLCLKDCKPAKCKRSNKGFNFKYIVYTQYKAYACVFGNRIPQGSWFFKFYL